MSPSTALAPSGLVKNQLSDQLRGEILNGTTETGWHSIVEGKWAAKFGVAQASIREAINILWHRQGLSPRRPAAALASFI